MITSPGNLHVKHIRSLAADRKTRRRERLFILEGVRLILDALESGVTLELVLITPALLTRTVEGSALTRRLAGMSCVHEAAPAVLTSVAETVHPQGVIALAHWPTPTPATPGIVLVVDALQDPGNLGTLLRSAEAAGVAEVLCSSGTVDAYAPKVVRAAMGAHLRLPLTQDLDWGAIIERLGGLAQIYAADAGAEMPYYAADWRQPSALIIGNEAAGLSEQARTVATRRIGIPMHGRTESLNAGVAGSIVLFEALRQRTRGRT